jgi:hypothetical protein
MVNPMEYVILLDRLEILKQEIKKLQNIKTKTPQVIKKINSIEMSIGGIKKEAKRL